MKGIIGKKLGMTQIYDSMGKVVPVTVVEAGPCFVTALRTLERDGYSAVQLGYGDRKEKNVIKPIKGQFEKAGIETNPTVLKEFRTAADSELTLGSTVTVEVLAGVKYVDITGTSKGKGFQGVVKRHGFAGGRASHGGDWLRRPGSIGMCEFPGRVYKGRKMPGHMGAAQVTTQGLEIVGIRAEDNVLLVKGAIPGPTGGTLYINKAKKK
ncbi:MAG: 50S ribosomal protein L3 [Lentisphaeria bacterium]